jgi:hypothetical protein
MDALVQSVFQTGGGLEKPPFLFRHRIQEMGQLYLDPLQALYIFFLIPILHRVCLLKINPAKRPGRHPTFLYL